MKRITAKEAVAMADDIMRRAEDGRAKAAEQEAQRWAMAMTKTTGRRLQPIDGNLPPLADFKPGDYCGPVMTYTAGVPIVFYRLPASYESFGHCASPPHRFRECEDGSLEIRESILHKSHHGTWHGYLDKGHNWREV